MKKDTILIKSGIDELVRRDITTHGSKDIIVERKGGTEV